MSSSGHPHEPSPASAGSPRAPQLPPAPAVRTLLWFMVVALPVAVLFATAGRVTLADPLNPYLWSALLGSASTVGLAALAAFEAAQPRRPVVWLLLPLPALALWFGATGLGCTTTLFAPGSWGRIPAEAAECLLFIGATAVPPAILAVTLIRWVAPPRPRLVGGLAGLAFGAAAVTLLGLVHPHDMALLDLLAHGVGVALVVAGSAALARPAKVRYRIL